MAESRVGPNSTGKEFEDASGLYYFGARWYDPALGLWLTPDPAGQFFNPYAYGGDPVNYVDPDGEFIFAAIIIGAAVGAYYGGSKANNSYNPMDWDADMKTLGYMAGGAVIGGTAAWGGFAAGTWATGAAGLSSGSGLFAATAGGTVGGAVGGGANYAGFYGMEMAGGDREWDTGEFFTGLGTSAGTGALMGGALGAASYGLSQGVRNATHQTVIEYGAKHGRYQDAINYASKNYGINVKASYNPNLNERGVTRFDKSVEIGPNAFDERDGSQLVQVLDHESVHPSQINDVSGIIQRRLGDAALPLNPSQGYIVHTREYEAYLYNLHQSSSHGYSDGVNYHVNKKFQESLFYLWGY